MTGGSARPRLAGLDVLRLLAVLLVVGRHFPSPVSEAPGWLRPFVTLWQQGGWVGVDLFFVLSGFLVSGLLFTEWKSRGRISPLRFYIRRGWKIYPPFYALIAATITLHLAFGLPLQRGRVLAELFFVQSYFQGLWSHTWSLAVEEHFYFSLPLVLLAVLALAKTRRTPVRPVLWIAGFLSVAALGLRILTWRSAHDTDQLTHVFPTHLRIDSLFFGVAISAVYHFHTDAFVRALRPWRWALIAGGLVLLTPAFAFVLEQTPFVYTVGFTLFYLGSGMLMVGVLMCELPRRPVVDFAAYLGAHSYSMYLWHLPVAIWGMSALTRVTGPLSFGPEIMIYVVASLALGVVMARVIETPALRLRDKWFPARDRGALETPSPVAATETRDTIRANWHETAR